MNTQRVVGILSAAIILLLSAAPGQAQFVTYQASGTIADAEGTLPSIFSSAAAGQTLTVDFTVNTAAAGSANAPGDNFYTNPIVSVSASIGSSFAAIGHDGSGVEVSADYLANGTYLYQTQYNAFAAANPNSAFTGIVSGFGLTTATSDYQPQSIYPDASLSNAPLSASLSTDTDSLVLAFTSYSDGSAQSFGDLAVYSDVSIQQVDGTVSAPEIDPTSAISAMTLLLGSLAVLRGRKVRGAALVRR